MGYGRTLLFSTRTLVQIIIVLAAAVAMKAAATQLRLVRTMTLSQLAFISEAKLVA
jgi:hypothetical protein